MITVTPRVSGDPVGSHARVGAKGIATAANGDLYIAEGPYNAIRKIAVNGVVTTVAGFHNAGGALLDGPAAAARFHVPSDLVLAPDGVLYVADTYNHAIRKITPAGEVTTLCGGSGPGSEDGAGRAARFRYPTGIARATDGTLYVADQSNHTVRRVTPDGTVTTLAGKPQEPGATNGNGSNARFSGLQGITVAADGRVYVTDWASVRQITAGGDVTTFAGAVGGWGYVDGPRAEARFNTLNGIVAGPDGSLYVADAGNSRIRKISANGVVSTVAGGYPMQFIGDSGRFDGVGAAARLSGPEGLALGSDGTLWVAEGVVRKITPEGAVTTLPVGSLFSRDITPNDDGSVIPFSSKISDVGFDSAGNLYIADLFHGCVRKLTPEGVITTLRPMARRPDGRLEPKSLALLKAIAVDRSGTIYVSTTGTVIYRMAPDGVLTYVTGDPNRWGIADGPAGEARLNSVQRMAVAPDGNLFVADTLSYTIRKITPAGFVTTIAGLPQQSGHADGTGSSARFAFVQGLSVGPDGNVYVADGQYGPVSNTIRKVTADGVVTTIAGNPGTQGDADGAGSAARLNQPKAVAVDAALNVYVADRNNRRICKVTPAGVVTTLAGSTTEHRPRDGIGAEAALAYADALAVDAAGHIYIGDESSLRVASPTIPSHPLNISTRVQVEEGERSLIGGLIVAGSNTKKVLVRAVGPSLTGRGVDAALADPELHLYDAAGTLLASNDDWKIGAGGNASQQAEIAATGLAPSDEREPALVVSLHPQQAYTAVVTAKGEPGIASVELYDLSTGAAAVLANLSTRGFVAEGEKVMIGGFILAGGAGSGTVMLRAIGPSLAGAGVSDPLNDPLIEVFDRNGDLVARNDNWQEQDAARIRATGIAPASDRESALLLSLPPGAYTGVVKGNGGSGTALVEVYAFR
ncbi:MAG TPA: SMP-30/gluconolactonase/LRE family protein [Chthoniobacterales bacterium]|nr:SMP-30/gluconolactonase/LRE family protein [Chthoniobacterales bacterium]